jgi:hypothetical protein
MAPRDAADHGPNRRYRRYSRRAVIEPNGLILTPRCRPGMSEVTAASGGMSRRAEGGAIVAQMTSSPRSGRGLGGLD